MSTQPESRLQRRIRTELESEFGDRLWHFKVHGGPFQPAGIPDIVGCVNGFFFSVEIKVKISGNRVRPTPLQKTTMRKIRSADGISFVATSPDEVIRKIRRKLNGKFYGTPVWNTWRGMRERCYNKKHISYSNYGAKGIGICDQWLKGVFYFWQDMGYPPEDYSIDRIDPLGNYEPSNCRWLPRSENSRRVQQ